MDPSSQFIVPTIIDVPELIVTNDDLDYDDSAGFRSGGGICWNKLQFLASALSYTIGLANLWRFPHLCYKHAGGAFLIAYTLVLVLIGLPLILMELAFGQYANEGPITIWRISPAFEGIGYSMCLVSALVAIYYNIINSLILHYLSASLFNLFGSVPWSSCDNSWNTDHCFLKPDNVTELDASLLNNGSSSNCTSNYRPSLGPKEVGGTNGTDWDTQLIDPDSTNSNGSSLFASNCSSIIMSSMINHDNHSMSNDAAAAAAAVATSFDKIINTTVEVTLPANEYFHINVLQLTQSISQLGGLNWNILLGLVIVWGVDFIIILKNLRPLSSRSALISLVMAYLTLIALLARALSLPGSSRGISYYFTLDWSKFQNIDIWLDATTQILFSLSPCWGGLITLANMNKFHTNFHANTMLIVLINYVTSLMAGLVAFAIIGYMSSYSGIAIDEVADVGLGFIFMVYTEALAQLPLASLNSLLFFAIMLFLGFNSQLVVMETVITTIVDTWPHKLRYRRPLVLVVLCAIMFIISLTGCFGNGLYIMQLFDTFSGTFTAMIIGILELLAIAWVYGLENFIQDIDDMISFHRNLFPSRSYWCFMWRYLTPSVMFAILLFSITDLEPPTYRHSTLPAWTMRLGWTLTLVCISVVPLLAFVRFLLSPSGSIADKISYLCRPSEDWAPSTYVSGPKLINRHHQMLDETDLMMPDGHNSSGFSGLAGHGVGGRRASGGAGEPDCVGAVYTSRRETPSYVGDQDDDDRDSNFSNEDLKVVNGRANYIIPEEEEDTDTGLITNETNV